MNDIKNLNGLNIAHNAELMRQATEVKAQTTEKKLTQDTKNSFFSKMFEDIGNFFYHHFTSVGRLELRESNAVKKIHRLEDKLTSLQEVINTKIADPKFVDQNPEEAKKILAKYNTLLKTHTKACETLDKVRGKLKAIDKATHGHERVIAALNSIENESKIAAYNAEITAEDKVFEHLRDSLEFIYNEYPEVFKKHPELNQQYEAIKTQQAQIENRIKLNESQRNLEQHKDDLQQIIKQKYTLKKKLGKLDNLNTEIQTDLNNRNEVVKSLKDELTQVNQSLKALNAKLEENKHNEKTINNEITLLDTIISKLNKDYDIELHVNSKKKFHYKHNVKHAATELVKAMETRAKLLGDVQNIPVQIAELEKLIAEGNKQQAALQHSLETKETAKALIEDSSVKLNKKMKNIQEDISYFQNEIKEKKADIEKTEKRIHTLSIGSKSPLNYQREKINLELQYNEKLEEINKNSEHIHQALQFAEEKDVELSDATMKAYKAKVTKLEDELKAIKEKQDSLPIVNQKSSFTA